MSYVTTTKGTTKPNFLDSEVGLVLKTAQIPASLGVVEGKYKVVPAGTIFPSNTASAKGIVFTDIDVTNGDVAGSIMVAGRVIADRLTIDDAAKSALSDISFVAGKEVTRA